MNTRPDPARRAWRARHLAAALFACGTLAATAQQEQSAPDPAEAKLEKLRASAQAYVEAFNKADAAAIANLYLPDGEINLADGQTISGREEIRDFYQETFAPEKDPQAALEAGAVRFVTPGIAVEEGTFHVTRPDGEVLSHNYTAVQVEQPDGSWLMASVRDSLKDTAPPAEKLLALGWIVGDWEIGKDGTTTYLSFDWSEDGPYLEGKAVTETPGAGNVTTTYRIGWDARREGFVSWGFDAAGGFTSSEWTRDGDNAWLLRTRGVTADGETNEGSQTIEVDESKQYFTWSMRDQSIGGEIQPDRLLKVVKRPPAPDSGSATPATGEASPGKESSEAE